MFDIKLWIQRNNPFKSQNQKFVELPSGQVNFQILKDIVLYYEQDKIHPVKVSATNGGVVNLKRKGNFYEGEVFVSAGVKMNFIDENGSLVTSKNVAEGDEFSVMAMIALDELKTLVNNGSVFVVALVDNPQ